MNFDPDYLAKFIVTPILVSLKEDIQTPTEKLNKDDLIKLFDPKGYYDPRDMESSLSNDFMNYLNVITNHVCEDLKIPRPKINFITDPKFTQEHCSFGGYNPSNSEIDLVILNRTCSDTSRTLVHELYHCYQDKQGVLTPESGNTGSEHENQANSYAGKIMREFNRKHPEILSLTNV